MNLQDSTLHRSEKTYQHLAHLDLTQLGLDLLEVSLKLSESENSCGEIASYLQRLAVQLLEVSRVEEF